MTEPVISLRDVTKTYHPFKLGPVSLGIEPGYAVAVVGPNGSGKSTLFRLLMDLARPDAGEVRLFGQHHATGSIDIAARVGYVPERAQGHDRMTVEELGSFTGHWYPAWDAAAYAAALAAMDLAPGKRFGDLSKGLQRRVTFALAMASGPELLLLDELTDGVDPFARREMLADIARFLAAGDRTVVFATHNMDEVRRLADYVVFLVDGAFLGMYEKDALLDDWRRIWTERPPAGEVPGLVHLARGQPAELVSAHWRETGAALEAEGIVVERTAPLDLTEILEHLMRRERAPRTGAEHPPVGTHAVAVHGRRR